MAGAAILTGKGAYASGCGLVRILTPEENRGIMQTSLPEAVLSTYSMSELNEDTVKDAIAWADAVLIGPGLGTNEVAERILNLVLENAAVPVVLDADALNLLAHREELSSLLPACRHAYRPSRQHRNKQRLPFLSPCRQAPRHRLKAT